MKGIKAIYDNGGLSIDQYTVYFSNPKDWGIRQRGVYPCLGMSATPLHPQGFCQHSEGVLGSHNGQKIRFEDLPKDCQKAVKVDLIKKEEITITQEESMELENLIIKYGLAEVVKEIAYITGERPEIDVREEIMKAIK